MIRDFYMQQIDALGKMLSVVLSQFLSKNEGIDFYSLEIKIQDNADLYQFYNQNDLVVFEEEIKKLKGEYAIQTQLIQFFYKLHKQQPNTVLFKQKCLLIFNHLDVITFETLQILNDLKESNT